ncbi:MAG TPA: hypothetical protein VMP08_01170, partial [Anaerolineae bacterium]|nr:hypothetical protein [Anaerolineae bacterium]
EETLWEYYLRDQWPRDQLVDWQSVLSLPVGTPPGQYQLRMRVVQPDSGAVVNFDQSDSDGYLPLGAIDLARPTQSLTRTALTEGVPVNASLGDALQLWATVPPADVIRPGLTFPLDLIWHTTRDLSQNYHFNLDVLTPDGRVLQTIEQAPLGGEFSAADWRAGDVVRQAVIIFMPSNAVSGDYPLRLQMFDSAGQPLTDRVPVGSLHVEEYPIQTAVPPLQIDRRAQFAEPIELLGANLSPQPYQAGGRLDIDLVWQASGHPANDYTVFVQLLDANGKPAAQGDGDPLNGLRLTSSWRPGEVIVDQHHVPLKDDLAPGDYTLYVGLYQRDTGDRVGVTVDGNQPPERWVNLGKITIVP